MRYLQLIWSSSCRPTEYRYDSFIRHTWTTCVLQNTSGLLKLFVPGKYGWSWWWRLMIRSSEMSLCLCIWFRFEFYKPLHALWFLLSVRGYWSGKDSQRHAMQWKTTGATIYREIGGTLRVFLADDAHTVCLCIFIKDFVYTLYCKILIYISTDIVYSGCVVALIIYLFLVLWCPV